MLQVLLRPPPGRHGFSAARAHAVLAAVLLVFAAVAGQLVRIAAGGPRDTPARRAAETETRPARPDLTDRNGHLLAADIPAPSLFADPARISAPGAVAETLAAIFPDLDRAALARKLSNPKRRFVWIKRRLPAAKVQEVLALRLPGLGFRRETKRVYPTGPLAGHLVAAADAALTRKAGNGTGSAALSGPLPPVRLSLDLGVAYALDSELAAAMTRYRAGGAAGVVLDVRTGEVLAAASLPETDPAQPLARFDPANADKVAAGVYELGSIFKLFTVAMALDTGLATPDTILDVREPLRAGAFTIRDLHPAGRPLSVAGIFLHSSNIGAGLLAKAAGPARQREFLARLGLLDPMAAECGPIAPPLLPERWGEAETVTIAYGHGIAVAPLQVAVAAAAAVNGGVRVTPTFLARESEEIPPGERVLSAATSATIRDLMRRNVTAPDATGRRAEAGAAGYRPGGKTGTADIPAPGGYRSAVISSFLAAFPMEDPAYAVLFLLFEPQGTPETHGEVTAGVNAAPAAGRLIARIAPLLGVAPQSSEVAGR